jgi:anthraniloyl-CoA monooxygenase
MRIVCVGGGPAGLYFAILMKRMSSEHEITVIDRSPAEASAGWGVVFWGDLLIELRATDPETARSIWKHAYQWHGQTLELRGTRTDADGFGYSIGRSKLLEVLTARATALGVEIESDREISSTNELPDADLIIACDGANSTLRRLEHDQFLPNIDVGRNKYAWLGTPRVFDSFTFAFVDTGAGWIWCHAYGFDEHTSTFVVECSPETWSGLGFDALETPDALARLEGFFAQPLSGAPLHTVAPDDPAFPWRNFRKVTNQHWSAGNTVLMGDAAHTTHFSIGHGTLLAIRDAIALANELRGPGTRAEQLAAYESNQRAALLRPQAEAAASAQWFENIDAHIEAPDADFFRGLRERYEQAVSS